MIVTVNGEVNLRKFGDAVRNRRVELGMSQEALAHRVGLDRTYVGGAERGERNVSLRNLIRIAHALDLSVSEMLEGVDE